MKTLAQIGYEAYAVNADGKSLVTGDRLPPWNELAVKVQVAWNAAAEAIEIIAVDRYAQGREEETCS